MSMQHPTIKDEKKIPTRKILFTDYRHIQTGNLIWVNQKGQAIPLHHPPGESVAVFPTHYLLPQGIRLQSQPAKKERLDVPPPSHRIMFDNGIYRAWTLEGEDMTGHLQYFESKDGYAWKETTQTTFPLPGKEPGIEGIALFKDPTGGPNEAYKAALTLTPLDSELAALRSQMNREHPRFRDYWPRPGSIRGLYGMVSPDGIHWQVLPKAYYIHEGDTDICACYDEWLERYVVYSRMGYLHRRLVGRVEAENFRRIGPMTPVLWPDPSDSLSQDIYSCSYTLYPGLWDYHLMFPKFYERYTERSSIFLYSSTDNIMWMRTPGGPVVTPGEPNDFDGEFISVGYSLIPLGSDRVGLPYRGYSYPHKYPRWPNILENERTGWVWWPEGRLSAVVAAQEGEFFTGEMIPAGRKLVINSRSSRAGQIRVGLMTIPGRTLEHYKSGAKVRNLQYVLGRSPDDCDPISGDSPAHPVHWKGLSDSGLAENQPCVLHFKLRAAELFGIEWI